MSSLQGHLLIAMPTLNDSYFGKSVAYICEHNESGAMGLVINNPVDLTLPELLDQVKDLDEDHDGAFAAVQGSVFSGGPVSPERGFVLHSAQPGCWTSSMEMNEDIMITTSRDILAALGTDAQPHRYLVTLGYAGWSAGQLEDELKENAWLTLPAEYDLLFDVPPEKRWEEALRRLGVDPYLVSPSVGNA